MPRASNGTSNADAASGLLDPRNARELLVLAEHAKSLFGQLPTALAGSLIAAILIVAYFWPVVNHLIAGSWLVLLVLCHLWRLWEVHEFKRNSRLPDEARSWLRRTTISATLGGALYGCLGFVFFVPGSPSDQAILLAIFAGIVVAGLSTYAAFGPTFRAFLIAIMSPVAIRLVVESSVSAFILLMLEIAFFSYILRSGMRMARILAESFRTRFENIDLIAELDEQKHAAQQANRDKSAFLAAASHDLRQPVHALSLFVSALSTSVSGEEQRHIIERIQASVDATEVMFNTLLDVSRLDAGILSPDLQVFSLQPMWQRLVAEYQPAARESGISFRARPCQHSIRSDPNLLERVLRNYISNAIRYTASGGVLMGVRAREGVLRIAVYDTGAGIAQDKLDLIFKEFYQIGNPERDRAKGLGLGLAIVQRISKLLEHRIGVRSLPGKGSCFWVDVPLAQPLAQECHTGLSCTDETVLYGTRILAIDDEPDIRDALGILLRQWGCQPIVAGSTADAMNQLLRLNEAPEAIVCDCRLPGGDTGIAAVRRIQEQHGADIPALLLTGDTAPERLREAADSGLPLLHKPLKTEQLKQALVEILS
jgi:signal transduction histidine kinase